MAGMGGVAEYPVLNNTIIHWEDGVLRPWGSNGGGVLGGKGDQQKFQSNDSHPSVGVRGRVVAVAVAVAVDGIAESRAHGGFGHISGLVPNAENFRTSLTQRGANSFLVFTSHPTHSTHGLDLAPPPPKRTIW